jgi:pimeloyl-ACP methyl ester carboxylesterase
MSLINAKQYKFKGAAKKLITADLTYANYKTAVPICIFVHGFKGFKDWGAWPLAAEVFAIKGYPFLKFNFSHNGTSPNHLSDFVDLEAFGNNNFKIEYDEVGIVLDFIQSKSESFDFEWNGQIHIIGHSRGGAIALLRAANDERITSCITWASVSSLERYVHLTDKTDWLNSGVHYVKNGRTGQDMPMYYQFVEAYEQNEGLLSLEENLGKITCPVLILHGIEDEAVPLSDSHEIYDEVAHSILVEIDDANHTFNSSHPLKERKISKQFAQVITESIDFLEM